jgi:predicted dinucleotide-utilizing enzyme
MLTQHALDDVFVQVNMAVETAASKAVERALQALKSQVRVNQMSFWHIYLLPFFV